MRLSLRFLLAFGIAAALTTTAWAADDPSIEEPLRGEIQAAMQSFIADATVDGVIRHYDLVTNEVLTLSQANLHSGIVRKGDFYVSCADFTDASGRKIDIDFLVLPDGDGVRAVQGFVHKIDGKKRPYNLEN